MSTNQLAKTSSTETASSPYRPSTNIRFKPRPGTTTQSSQENSTKGDLVLVRTTQTESWGKLEPKWEGPFIVKTKASPSAYRLATSSDEDLEHSWNIDNLRKFFV
jgi:hypothetical protein